MAGMNKMVTVEYTDPLNDFQCNGNESAWILGPNLY